MRGHFEPFREERGATVLLASRSMSEVERLCERVIIMKRGRIEDDDTPQRLIRYGRETSRRYSSTLCAGAANFVRRRDDQSRSFEFCVLYSAAFATMPA